jgi:hypothetical protein
VVDGKLALPWLLLLLLLKASHDGVDGLNQRLEVQVKDHLFFCA